MAVTSLWRIKGNVKAVLDYASNEEKTTAQSETDAINNQNDLSAVISYTTRNDSIDTQLVTGINCTAENAYLRMMQTKRDFHKTDGTTAYHGYQSFAPGEVTPEQAHEIGKALAHGLWGDRHQVLVCTHVDKGHIHNHFVINTVSFVDGRKFVRTNEDYRKMQQLSDELCTQYGLFVIKNSQGKRKPYLEYQKEKNGVLTQSEIIRNDIDDCIKTSPSMKLFYREMQQRGYSFDFSRKYTTVTHTNFSKPRRLKTLGTEYTLEAISRRVKANDYPIYLPNKKQERIADIFFEGNPNKEFDGFQMKFVAYISGLRHVKANPNSTQRLRRLIGEELDELDRLIEEQELIVDNNIECYEDIVAYKAKCEDEMTQLSDYRDNLRKKQRNATNHGDSALATEIKDEISAVTKRMSYLRKHIKICQRGIDYGDRFEQNMKMFREEATKEMTKSRQRSR